MTIKKINPELNAKLVDILTEQAMNIDRSLNLTWTVYGAVDNGATKKEDLILRIGCHTYHRPTNTILQETLNCSLDEVGHLFTHLSTIAKVHGRYYDLRSKHGD
jgi:hypothetical protein